MVQLYEFTTGSSHSDPIDRLERKYFHFSLLSFNSIPCNNEWPRSRGDGKRWLVTLFLLPRHQIFSFLAAKVVYHDPSPPQPTSNCQTRPPRLKKRAGDLIAEVHRENFVFRTCGLYKTNRAHAALSIMRAVRYSSSRSQATCATMNIP